MTFAHLDALLALVEEPARRFQAAGWRLYLVGGIVRDQWLDLPLDDSADLDFTTDAHPGDIKALVRDWADDLWTQGERFGTIGLHADDRAWEITTHRAETYREDSRKPDVQFGDDVVVDLSRRDFTVNAMAISVPDGELIDPWGGADDLAAGRLATPLGPDVSFNDDPLRMLRAARFATRYDLEPVPELAEAARTLHPRLRIVAIERIGDEIERLLSLVDPTRGLRFLADTGLLAEVLAWGEADSITLDRAAVDRAIAVAAGVGPVWQLRLAGLLVGAFGTVEAVDGAAARLRLATADRRLIVRASRAALGLLSSDVDAASVRRWAAPVEHPEPAFDLARAIAGAGRDSDPEPFLGAYEALAASEQLHGVAPVLSGDRIMELYDVAAGPVVGEVTRRLEEHRIEHGPLTREAAEALVREWRADRRPA